MYYVDSNDLLLPLGPWSFPGSFPVVVRVATNGVVIEIGYPKLIGGKTKWVYRDITFARVFTLNPRVGFALGFASTLS